MLQTPGYLGYVLTEKLHEGGDTVIYRALREADSLPVVIKATRGEHPAPRTLSNLQHEHSLLRELTLPGVVRAYALERSGSSLALILEDFGGQSLNKLTKTRRLSLEEVLSLTVSVAETLESLHAHPILHKDLKPHNILLNPQTRQVKLIDFSLATRLSQESQRTLTPGLLEGTLAYMSPEQTGRMNRVVDARSDLYSLGATLYELLSGVVPFQASDAVEMIHSHIARRPLPLREREPSVPQVLSDLVMKLLAKAAEDRYQSAQGLRADLQECLRLLRTRGEIPPFVLGQRDLGGELRIPQRLYGRETESTALLSAFHRVSHGSAELLLLSGYAGVGKSALVQEIYKGIAQRSGYFIAGKFDQLGRHIPYAPVAHAFRQLVQELLTESPAALEAWRRKLCTALGPNGQLLISLIPELLHIVGPQPEVPELGPTESKNRFSLVFQNFLRVFATAEHPLILFLDDLQWADPASLWLLQILLTDPGRGHLLVIGAYRDQEVGATHPLRQLLSELQREGTTVEEHALKPLELQHVQALLADMLSVSQAQVTPLALLVQSKTQGNPFFLSQFVGTLYKERLLTFEAAAGQWSWDLERIAAAQATQNVVDFMTEQLRRLSPSTQKILKLAASIGYRFELGVLAAIKEEAPAQVAGALWEAMKEGLVLPLGSEYRFLTSGAEAPEVTAAQARHVAYRFLHDRVQQAAYALIPVADRPQIHLRIGRQLRAQERIGNEGLFDQVNHLNHGAVLLTDPAERRDLAHLNLVAGQRAKAATAYATAAGYLRSGITLLPADAWDSDHQFAFELHAECAESTYLGGQPQEAEGLFRIVLTHARSVEEQLRVHNLRIALCTTLGAFGDAIEAGRVALKLYGIELPATDQELQAALGQTLAQMEEARAGRSIEALIDSPVMTSPEQQGVLRVLMLMVSPAYFVSPVLFSLLTSQMVVRSLRHGNSDVAPYGYLSYGFLLATILGRAEEGYRFGRMGLALHEKLHNTSLICKLNFLFGIYQHLCRPLRSALPYLTRAVHSGLEIGDLTYTSFALCHIGFSRVALGDPLDSVREEVDRHLTVMQRTQDVLSMRVLRITRQSISCLEGRTTALGSLNDDAFDEQTFVAETEAAGFPVGVCYFYIAKLQMLYLSGDHAQAAVMAARADALQATCYGLFFRTELPLYACLTAGALYPDTAAEERPKLLEAMQRHLTQLQEWERGCPANFHHQRLLAAAELARVRGQDAEAIGLYEQSIAAAQQQGFIPHAALASELAARFHLSRQRATLAGSYLREAHYGYLRWGATAKTSRILEQYPQLTRELLEPMSGTTTSTSSSSRRLSKVGVLDVTAVVHAAQAIASEMRVDRVVEQLMRSVMAHAGAQRGFLLVPRDGTLILEAALSTEPDRVEVGMDQPLSADSRLAVTVVNYVHRSRETVVLGNARAERRFASDPYITEAQPRSILCLALLHQGRSSAILYLENNSAEDAFTQERVELLRLLAAQAAIALENAKLYADVQRSSTKLQRANEELELVVSQRTQDLQAATTRLRSANEGLVQLTEELRRANERLQDELCERERTEKARAALQEEIIGVQRARLQEMSTPLIPITDQIMVMPLIGTMDTSRAQQVLSTALEGAQRSAARVVILDITGMTHMDGSVARTLVNTAHALRLLGAQAILTGIRAEFAQLLVGQDVDLSAMATLGTLQSGIAYALGRTQEAAHPSSSERPTRRR